MDYLKIMKTVETLSLVVCIFLVTWSHGDGAPQWRPQGRFGKRFSSRDSSDIISALRTAAAAEDLDLMREDQPEVRNDDINQLLKSISIPTGLLRTKLCEETDVENIYKCHRLKRSARRPSALSGH